MRSLTWIALLGAALAAACNLAGCKRPVADVGAGPAPSDPSGYLTPPSILSATRAQDGSLVLAGRSPGETEVRLQQPAGDAFSATSDDEGAWSITLPRDKDPRMFALEGEDQGRILHAEGALLTLPAPGPPAVLARAGYGALVIGERPGPLRICAIDYDGAGGGAVSGVTAPRAPVRLVLDDKPVGASEANERGWFTVLDLSARAALDVGVHTFRIETQSGGRTLAVEGRWPVTRPAALTDAMFRWSRSASAWRVDWRIPGGGLQTTVVFDQPSRAVAS